MLSQTVLVSLALSTCAMPSGDIRDPQTWGQYFLDKYAAERAAAVQNIEAGPTPLAVPRTVLLITGVTIPAEWFDPIVARLSRDGFNPVVWEPPALLSGSLAENSEALAEVVDNLRAETGEATIDILAECTGGVIARHYIQSLGGDQYIDRMVTFISPQAGIPKASLAHKLVGWPALRDLTPGSAFLTAVASAPLPPNVNVTSIYTCTDEYIQPYKTSIIPGAKNIGVGCNGTFVGHYQFFYDPAIYNMMHAELIAPLKAGGGKADGDETDETGDANEVGGCNASGAGGSSAALVVLGIALAGLRRRRSR
jgi:MYXO-CTERM domain-containing protein